MSADITVELQQREAGAIAAARVDGLTVIAVRRAWEDGLVMDTAPHVVLCPLEAMCVRLLARRA